MATAAPSGTSAASRLQAPHGTLSEVRPQVWAVVGLTLLAAVLRFATLDAQSYWFDEAQSAHEFSLSFGGMWSFMVSHESNPPLYFVLGWVWAKLFGTGAISLRTISALAGTAVIPVTFLIARELVSERAGLVAAALAAVSPFMIWYSQEAREYMLLALLCGLSMLYFSRFLNRRERPDLVRWGVVSGLAILTHAFAGFLIAPEAIVILFLRRDRVVAAVLGGLLVVQAAVLPLLVSHSGSALTGFIRATPLPTRIRQVPVAFAANTLYQSSAVDYGLYAAAGLAALVIFLMAAGATRRELRGGAIAAGLAACVLVVPLLAAAAGKDYYLARALIPAWIPLAVMLGAACTVPGLRGGGAALAGVLLALFVWAHVKIQSDGNYQRTDWRGVAAALGRPVYGARAIIVYQGGLAIDPLVFYLPGVPFKPSAEAVTVHEVDVVGNPYQQLANPPAAGAQLVSRRSVGGFVVDRFALNPSWELSPDQFIAEAQHLVGPASPDAIALVQR